MGVSVEIDTSEFKWYWKYRWNDLLISLRLRKRPPPSPFAETWSTETQMAIQSATVLSDLRDRII